MSEINVDIVNPQAAEKVNVNGLKIKGSTEASSFGSVNIGPYDSGVDIFGAVIIGANAGSVTQTVNASGMAIGSECLSNALDLASNIAIGTGCMKFTTNSTPITKASNNIAIGISAGRNLESAGAPTASNNTIIGRFAGTEMTTGINNIVIGNEAEANTPTSANSITLGDNQISSLRCNVNTITSLSDARDKKGVKTLGVGIDFIKGLKPVEFIWDERGEKGKKDIKDFGFIAQDLKKSQEETDIADTLNLVSESNPDKLEASYGRLLPIIVKAMQEISEKIELIESKLK